MIDQAFTAARSFGGALLLLGRCFLSIPALRRLLESNRAGEIRVHIATKAKINAIAYERPIRISGSAALFFRYLGTPSKAIVSEATVTAHLRSGDFSAVYPKLVTFGNLNYSLQARSVLCCRRFMGCLRLITIIYTVPQARPAPLTS